MRNVGFEPTRCYPQEPKSCMSANSINSAKKSGLSVISYLTVYPSFYPPCAQRAGQNTHVSNLIIQRNHCQLFSPMYLITLW